MAMVVAVALNFGASLAVGAVVAFILGRDPDTTDDDTFALFVFFMSLASIFGIGGAYLGCRHIRGHAPLWAIPVAIGTFAIALPLFTYPNTAGVINWIAGVAAACALASTAIAHTMSSSVTQKHRNAAG